MIGRAGAAERASRFGLAIRAAGLLSIGLLASLGCRSGDPVASGRRKTADAVAALHRRVEEMRQGLERRAVEVRNDLESARLKAEAIVRQRTALPEGAVHDARRQARLALHRGSEVLQQAAKDGGAEAAGWARVIQERMGRLEEALDALAGGSREHADS